MEEKEEKKEGPEAGMDLEELRRKVDELDRGIVRLISERGDLCKAIARSKRNLKVSLHDPEREEEVYRNIKSWNLGPFPDEAIRAIYREIIRAALELEGKQEANPHRKDPGG